MNTISKTVGLIAVATIGLAGLAHAEEARKTDPKDWKTILVTLKQVTLEGKTLSEASTYIAQYPSGSFEGTMAINVGDPDKLRMLVVEFEAPPIDREPVIRFEVSDPSVVRRGVRDGTSYAIPVELLEVVRPRKRADLYTIYSTQAKKLVIAFQEIEETEKGTPQPPNKSE